MCVFLFSLGSIIAGQTIGGEYEKDFWWSLFSAFLVMCFVIGINWSKIRKASLRAPNE